MACVFRRGNTKAATASLQPVIRYWFGARRWPRFHRLRGLILAKKLTNGNMLLVHSHQHSSPDFILAPEPRFVLETRCSSQVTQSKGGGRRASVPLGTGDI